MPQGTVQMIDTMMGGMMQGMVSMMSGMAGEESEVPQMPKSVAEEMFANKKEILKKAKEPKLSYQ